MKFPRLVPPARVIAVTAAAVIALSACGQNAPDTQSDGEAAAYPPGGSLEIIAPAGAGGGWDGTARSLAQVAQGEGLASDVQVINIEGAGGTIGLARFATDDKEGQLMVMGATMVGAIQTNKSDTTLEDVVPIATITSEHHVLVVPKDSPYETLEDFTEAFKADPGGNSIAGGSAGGSDHITAGLYAEAIEVDPTKVNYVPFSGGGEALAAILGGQVAAGISNPQEWAAQIDSGDLRVLAVTAPERLESLDAPTFTEQGVDVTFGNWRGIVAPPGTTDEQKTAITEMLTKLHDSEAWQEQLETNGWGDDFRTGDEAAAFFDEQTVQIEETLKTIGLL
ncbi:tripartite tricarboxylate transporter substrate binding protein [Ornithinimicrobium cavernae]|uniref:tripartite tricarboxylate transporter substrate binding protein n=1 Tax=Ornithinimicrobium cavernae TaxID=2666047 RepID=UPI000D6A0343|nr:tripartite tricarboxylate transporter substrate binding protein [Ornithinimicrobium cavernae]